MYKVSTNPLIRSFLTKPISLQKSLTYVKAQPFSLQSDMEAFDFSDKLNIEELKLKNPE